jgi:hypothetical protein
MEFEDGESYNVANCDVNQRSKDFYTQFRHAVLHAVLHACACNLCMQSPHAGLHAGLHAGSEWTQLAEYAQGWVSRCMYTACRVCGGLSEWMHVHSMQSMRRVEWVDACTQHAEYAQAWVGGYIYTASTVYARPSKSYIWSILIYSSILLGL